MSESSGVELYLTDTDGDSCKLLPIGTGLTFLRTSPRGYNLSLDHAQQLVDALTAWLGSQPKLVRVCDLEVGHLLTFGGHEFAVVTNCDNTTCVKSTTVPDCNLFLPLDYEVEV